MNAPRHIVSAAAVVLDDAHQVLLIRGPRRGWEMPGGQVEEGESLAAAAVRETREETGVDIEIVRFCGVFHNVSRGICNTLFLARPVGGRPRPTTESLETAYFPVAEAVELVSFSNFRERIEACLRPDGQPVYVEFDG